MQILPPIDLERVERALTSKKWDLVYRDPAKCPERLLDALVANLTHISPESWEERFCFGGLHINGVPATSLTAVLPVPCRIEYFEPGFPIREAKSHFPPFDGRFVLYQDNDLVVVWKPSGLPCMPNREQNHFHLKGYIEQIVGKTVHLPSRLDTSTQGVVAISASERMNAPLQQAYEKRKTRKYYLLQTSGVFQDEEVDLRCRIARHPEHAVLRTVSETEGKQSHTEFVTLSSDSTELSRQTSVVLARPHTGRTHQLRVHARHLGAPIVGDNFYGGYEAQRLRLVSFRLILSLPGRDRPVDVHVPSELLPEWVSKEAYEKAVRVSEQL
jgi:23S rRNA-/tRNA-specific pseudouridylate synthase